MEEVSFKKQASGFDIARIQALTDGIFAFAMTLLVLDLKQTPIIGNTLWQQLQHLSQTLLYYILSFLILGVFWTGHHAEFHYINKTNRVHLWLNIFLLMCIAIIPYSASLLGNKEHQLFAVVVYSLNITITTLAYLLHWHYATSNSRLSVPDLPKQVIWDVKKRLIVSNVLLVFSLVLTFWNEVVGFIFYITIQFYYIFKTTRTKTGIPSPLDKAEGIKR